MLKWGNQEKILYGEKIWFKKKPIFHSRQTLAHRKKFDSDFDNYVNYKFYHFLSKQNDRIITKIDIKMHEISGEWVESDSKNR